MDRRNRNEEKKTQVKHMNLDTILIVFNLSNDTLSRERKIERLGMYGVKQIHLVNYQTL